jgi:hypothetical protein
VFCTHLYNVISIHYLFNKIIILIISGFLLLSLLSVLCHVQVCTLHIIYKVKSTSANFVQKYWVWHCYAWWPITWDEIPRLIFALLNPTRGKCPCIIGGAAIWRETGWKKWRKRVLHIAIYGHEEDRPNVMFSISGLSYIWSSYFIQTKACKRSCTTKFITIVYHILQMYCKFCPLNGELIFMKYCAKNVHYFAKFVSIWKLSICRRCFTVRNLGIKAVTDHFGGGSGVVSFDPYS